MTAEEQKRYINYLAERVHKADFDLRVRDAVLQDFLDKQKDYEERLSKLDSILSDVEDLKVTLASETKKRKAAERKVADLTAKLKDESCGEAFRDGALCGERQETKVGLFPQDWQSGICDEV